MLSVVLTLVHYQSFHDFSIQFLVKKEGFGGGGSRMVQFHQGQGDVTLLKPSGRTLNVTIGPGLPSSTSKLIICILIINITASYLSCIVTALLCKGVHFFLK